MTQVTDRWRRVAERPGGRRTKFAVIGIWLVVLFALGPLAGKLERAQENDPADYVPASAESVEAIERLEGFPSDDQADAITVFHRDGGLTAPDRAAVERVRTAVNERVRPTINAERADTVAATEPAEASDGGAGARGTFSTLAVLPLVMLTEIGFTIAVGVLIDTLGQVAAGSGAGSRDRRPGLVALQALPRPAFGNDRRFSCASSRPGCT